MVGGIHKHRGMRTPFSPPFAGSEKIVVVLRHLALTPLQTWESRWTRIRSSTPWAGQTSSAASQEASRAGVTLSSSAGGGEEPLQSHRASSTFVRSGRAFFPPRGVGFHEWVQWRASRILNPFGSEHVLSAMYPHRSSPPAGTTEAHSLRDQSSRPRVPNCPDHE